MSVLCGWNLKSKIIKSKISMRSLLAAIMMFTRLPLWRIVNVDKRYFMDVIKYWPLVGVMTGATTGGVLWLSAQIVPLEVACILAILTGLVGELLKRRF